MVNLLLNIGLVQGMVTSMRGLCNGLGPAVYGFIFYLFHVDLNEGEAKIQSGSVPTNLTLHIPDHIPQVCFILRIIFNY